MYRLSEFWNEFSVIFDYIFLFTLRECEFITGNANFVLNVSFYRDLPIIPPLTSEPPPVSWWVPKCCDKSLLVGTYKLGCENYFAMRDDPALCFHTHFPKPSATSEEPPNSVTAIQAQPMDEEKADESGAAKESEEGKGNVEEMETDKEKVEEKEPDEVKDSDQEKEQENEQHADKKDEAEEKDESSEEKETVEEKGDDKSDEQEKEKENEKEEEEDKEKMEVDDEKEKSEESSEKDAEITATAETMPDATETAEATSSEAPKEDEEAEKPAGQLIIYYRQNSEEFNE